MDELTHSICSSLPPTSPFLRPFRPSHRNTPTTPVLNSQSELMTHVRAPCCVTSLDGRFRVSPQLWFSWFLYSHFVTDWSSSVFFTVLHVTEAWQQNLHVKFNLKMLFLHLPKLYLGRLMWSFKSRVWKQRSSLGRCCLCFCLPAVFLSQCNSTSLSNDPLLPDWCLTVRRREEKKKNLQNMVVVVLFVTPTPACVASLLISNTKAKCSSFHSCHLVWGSLCLAEGRGFGVVNGGSNTPSYEWGLSRSQTLPVCVLAVCEANKYLLYDSTSRSWSCETPERKQRSEIREGLLWYKLEEDQ